MQCNCAAWIQGLGVQWFLHHQSITLVAVTWIFNNIISVLVSSLPAPTKDSSAQYVYWFKVLNTIIGNLHRASCTAIEHSPNWQDAIAAHMARVNGNPTSTSNTGAKA
jgi:hypothetical protein